MPRPFRWDITRREQLGSLVHGDAAETYPEFVEDLRHCCARVVAAAGDARLVFVGRSPESIFDYLSGALAETSWIDRLTLFNIALRRVENPQNVPSKHALAAEKEQIAALGLDPLSIATAPAPVALIDLIATGETIGAVIALLLDWAAEAGVDSEAVRRRLRVVGITGRGKNSPNTWRWQQRSPWASKFRRSALRGVSIPWRLWDYLGNWQQKVSRTNPAWRWADDEMHRPPREPEHAEALRLAVQLNDLARTPVERAAFSALVAEQPSMRNAWLRRLVTELRRAT